MVTQSDIVDGLRRLALGPGSIVVVHSSLSSFGRVEGGAAAVIAALEETVTPSGLVAMPVHSVTMEGHPLAQPFDSATSPATTGRVPETFWRQPGVWRSGHPTHSVAAWGERAEELVADHERRGPVGLDSPLARAAAWGGVVLQLGVDHRTNTTLHHAEVLAEVPYLTVPYRKSWGRRALVRRADGSVDRVPMVEGQIPGCSAGFYKIEPLLASHGLTRQIQVGRSRVRATPSGPMLDVAVALLRRDPSALLCDYGGCENCVNSRRAIASARESV